MTGTSVVCTQQQHPSEKVRAEAREGGKVFAWDLPSRARTGKTETNGNWGEYGRTGGKKRSLRHLGWWEIKMFKLASCPSASQKVQSLVKMLSRRSDPHVVKSGERVISQTRTMESDVKSSPEECFLL